MEKIYYLRDSIFDAIRVKDKGLFEGLEITVVLNGEETVITEKRRDSIVPEIFKVKNDNFSQIAIRELAKTRLISQTSTKDHYRFYHLRGESEKI